MTIPDKRSTLADDLYIIIGGWENNGETATFKVYINPLVNWIWLGGIVMMLGSLVAAWPTPQERTVSVSSKAKLPGAAVPAK
jgi:cytochrome c-type biogenesis protein CcmF